MLEVGTGKQLHDASAGNEANLSVFNHDTGHVCTQASRCPTLVLLRSTHVPASKTATCLLLQGLTAPALHWHYVQSPLAPDMTAFLTMQIHTRAQACKAAVRHARHSNTVCSHTCSSALMTCQQLIVPCLAEDSSPTSTHIVCCSRTTSMLLLRAVASRHVRYTVSPPCRLA